MAKDILIRKNGGSDTSVYGLSKWGIVATELPFKIVGEMKDIPSNNWYDENGDDEFIPTTPVYKAYEMEPKFIIEASSMGTLISNIREFILFLANDGDFAMYNPNTSVGRTNIRYVSYSDEATYNKLNTSDGVSYVCKFSLKLKVNNPIDNVVLNV